MPPPKAKPETLAREQRLHRAVDLRLRSYTLQEIADELGIAAGTARSWIEEVREQWRRERIEDFDRLRADWLAAMSSAIGEALRSHDQEPDPRYLAVVVNGLAKMADVLGLKEAPPGSDGELPEIDKPSQEMTVAQARAALPLA